MEENREYSHNHYDEENTAHKHHFMRHLCTAIMTLIGAFVAFYVVTDWHYKRLLDPAVQMRKMDRMVRADERYMEKMAANEFNKERRIVEKTESFIRLEKTDKNYRVIVDLRPFDNDEKNVEVTSDGNVLSINAAGAANRHGHERILRVSQNYMFDDDVNLSDMTKIREGKDLVIYIPIKK